MKKIVLVIIMCLYAGFANCQDDPILLYSKSFEDTNFLAVNNLEHFAEVYKNSNLGIAYIDSDNVKLYNTEEDIKTIWINRSNIQQLSSDLTFSNTVELIVLKISDINDYDNLSLICSHLENFTNLNYLYVLFEIEIDNSENLAQLECIEQFRLIYSIQTTN
jgi:hypothetical protein